MTLPLFQVGNVKAVIEDHKRDAKLPKLVKITYTKFIETKQILIEKITYLYALYELLSNRK